MLNLFIEIYISMSWEEIRGIYLRRRLTTNRTCCPFGSFVLIKKKIFFIMKIYHKYIFVSNKQNRSLEK